MKAAEDAEKDLLRHILRIVAMMQQAHAKTEDIPLETFDEFAYSD